MAKKNTQDQTVRDARIRECYTYDPDSGKVFWKVKTRKTKAGDEAGFSRGTMENDYLCAFLDNKKYYLHRLCWFLHYGFHPPKGEMIDHINQKKNDNRLSNLRLASKKDNSGNMPIISTNTSGYRGVSWDKRRQAWAAYINRNNKKKHIGFYKTPILAAKAYDAYAIDYFGSFYANLNFPEAV